MCVYGWENSTSGLRDLVNPYNISTLPKVLYLRGTDLKYYTTIYIKTNRWE